MGFVKTVIRQGEKITELDQENKTLYEKNKELRNDNEELKLQNLHSKVLAEDTLSLLNLLQEIDNRGNSEDTKKKDRNVIINNLRQRNINIIKELASDKHTSSKLQKIFI